MMGPIPTRSLMIGIGKVPGPGPENPGQIGIGIGAKKIPNIFPIPNPGKIPNISPAKSRRERAGFGDFKLGVWRRQQQQ